jgi:hypothetical protein
MAGIERVGAYALAGSWIGMILVMALHPTHTGPWIHGLSLSGAVHAGAMMLIPVMTLGFLTLTLRLAATHGSLSFLAFAFFTFASVADMMAATMSGFLKPQLVSAATEAQRGLLMSIDFAFSLNQAFANVFVFLSASAICLWALAWPVRGVNGWVMRGGGLTAGIGILAWQASGFLTLNVHGMGAVVLVEAIWSIAAAIAMLRKPGRGSL